MAGQIIFKVLPDFKITLVYYRGTIDVQLLKNHLVKMTASENYNPEFNAVTDFGNCDFNITNQELAAVADHIKQASGVLGKRQHAFISRKPKQQVLSSLFSMLMGSVPVGFNEVDSKREAFEFVGVKPKHQKLVRDEFKSLAKQS
ncbi:MAG: hypothetical protein HKO94_03490 [Flavobacteriaceae bacterium]|nr:hypothetical protein [Flavobacteriaceae bacterium]